MSAAGFRSTLVGEHPDFAADALDATAWARLERLTLASPLYAQTLRRFPQYCLWLEEPRNLHTTYRFRALADEWRAFAAPDAAELADDNVLLSRLRRWRHLMSLRIAHRGVNELADEATCVAELTRLAEFCLRECHLVALHRWTERHGEPWDEELGRPARFCALALGKLGGEELNFSSDIDLLYLYEGEGHCRRDGVPTTHENPEFFAKLAETITHVLTEQTEDGFLFRVDTRLRPDGAHGPLVPSLAALENYYATGGQTWERLALLKARPVAGDRPLGAELLENLHSFRYPRHPPPSLLAEVAAMKLRTEREVVGAAVLARDVKNGPGGIRDIEFVAQSLQLLHAGRLPFLQTHSTVRALGQLARYELLKADEAGFLQEAYWFLRRVEHRVQMRDERQTHLLPDAPAGLAAMAASLGFASVEAFQRELDRRRTRVRQLYDELFADRDVDRVFEAWWTFFTTGQTPAPIAGRLARWFGGAPDAARALRVFACGDHRMQITRELITRFQHLAESFDTLLPELAQPLETLARLARFAERYGTRQQFFNSCADNPQLLRVLALLCDRSGYIVELLCAHPEILEEVLRPEILRQKKSRLDLAGELAAGPPGAERDAWLWLYVRAEQVRHAIGELLGFFSIEEVEAGLSQLADAVLAHVCPSPQLLIVALGKYGGAELTFGSDLDVLLVAAEGDEQTAGDALQQLRRTLQHGGPLGVAYEFDLRLRPHGDAGPLITTLSSLAAYHQGGGAQTWEKQLLTRARVVAGAPGFAARFMAWRDQLVYAAPLSDAELAAVWTMRARIQRERDPVSPPERAFKTSAGGLVDFEFLAQTLQLLHGHADPRLRVTGTRTALRALAAAGVIPPAAAPRFLENYAFLKRIEIMLRRDTNCAVSTLGASSAERFPLARWLGYADEPLFWAEYTARLQETRQLVAALADPAQGLSF
ncbi:MAG: bifunctional [glutamate--ammonia ligase]-adenylyl-L-tyrosine phosphorylase/[glutamate--ammonia-ligase] adenylyltransferase [Verrucomicrobia bacterium]|nr:bifunctional [glutamate--ammonia ligase]-adenylyl-L-tyrosine phosphorylase/[glutamate--ammonia-ligase] adenylyltransferase [Verrucomicrobiota bacterium]